MKSCPQCSRAYSDETFSFCLFDGTSLSEISDSEITHVLSSADSFDSIITVVSSSSNKPFKEDFIFDEIASERVSIKIISQFEEIMQIALKVVVKNLAKKKKDIFVEIQAVDEDGFELESYTLSAKLKAGEVKTVSQKQEIYEDTFRNIREWQIREISQYD